MKYLPIKNYVGEELLDGGTEMLDILLPLDRSIILQVSLSTSEAMDKAVKTTKEAFPSWSTIPIKERVQVFFRYKQLLERNIEEPTQLVHEVNGKTIDGSKAEVLKSIELTEFICSMPQPIFGEILEVSKSVENMQRLSKDHAISNRF